MTFKHLIDLDDYTITEWRQILDLALDIDADPKKYFGALSGKILATLFYEPSTRTQMSFQTAMLRLGGTIIGFDNPQNSSIAKGENLKDTIKVVSNYADIIAIRHPKEGSARAAAYFSDCPVINAGDGGHLHPTQTLTDMLTLLKQKGTLENLTIGICGDLKYGRTVHSLLKALSKFPNNTFILISTKELKLPDYIKKILDDNGSKYQEVFDLKEALPYLDVLYMTRIQKERFSSEQEYLEQKNIYVLDCEKLKVAKPDLRILHPLPRVDEIELSVDDDPRAVYFYQAKCGVYARMALILTILNSHSSLPVVENALSGVHTCHNKNCITNTEKYLPPNYTNQGGNIVCKYCDHIVTEKSGKD